MPSTWTETQERQSVNQTVAPIFPVKPITNHYDMDASATIPHGLKNKKRKAHKITADNHSPAPEPSTASLIESIKKKSKAAFVNDTSTPTPEEHKESKKDKKNGKQIDQDPTPSNGEDESPNDGAEEEEEALEAAEEMEELKSFADLVRALDVISVIPKY